MKRSCFPPEEIGGLLNLAPEDPRQVHLNECPRCQAHLESYRRFLDPPVGAHVADLADARIRLDAALSREIPGYEDPSESPVEHRRRAASVPAFRWLLKPIPLTAGVLMLAALLLLSGRNPFGRDETPQMRGETTDRPGSSSRSLEAFPARPGPKESVELRWLAVPGVGTYQVRLFSTDLSPYGAVFTVKDTILMVHPGTWEPPPASGELLYWQVAAILNGESAQSEIQVLRIP